MAAQWEVTIGSPHTTGRTNIGPVAFRWKDGDEVLFSYQFRSMRQTAAGAREVKAKLVALRDAALAPAKPNAMTVAMNKE